MAGKYVYLSELKVIQGRVPAVPKPLPPELARVNTPLVAQEWQSLLERHPDSEFCQYLLDGFQNGFRIGYDYENHILRSAKKNMASSGENPTVVKEYLEKEQLLGRVLGPLEPGSLPLHISRFGVIPKSSQPGKWRLILDLSHPCDYSVNDGIEPELCSLSYASVDSAVAVIMRLGKGSLLAKVDLDRYGMGGQLVCRYSFAIRVALRPENLHSHGRWPLVDHGREWSGICTSLSRRLFNFRPTRNRRLRTCSHNNAFIVSTPGSTGFAEKA